MLPKDIWELLLTHRVHVIACGDPAQLPPVNKDSDNHILDTPHIFLDEIMRQAAESEIIQLTMNIRTGQQINEYKGVETQVLNEEELIDGMYYWANQIVVATNKKRLEINDYMRQALGYESKEPGLNDKIICCRNAWDILDTKEEMALVNGTIGYIKEFQPEVLRYNNPIIPDVPIYRVTMETEDGEIFENLAIDKLSLINGQKTLSPYQEYKLNQLSKHNPDIEIPLEFNFGYAITCHRAQGSEWNKVLVIEERFPFDKEEHRKWLYTSCSRASEKLVLIR